MIRWLWAIHPLAAIGVMTGAAIAVIAFGTYVYKSIEGRGFDKAIAAVAADNKEAKDRVRKATKLVHVCFSTGGEWDVTRGVCLER